MNSLRLALIGFGNVGREFSRILLEKENEWRSAYHCGFTVTAVATQSRGCLLNPAGVDLNRALREIEESGRFAASNPDYSEINPEEMTTLEFVDIVVEITTLNIEGGTPAVTHIRSALNHGKHVITANKGPIAFAYQELKTLAAMEKRYFLFEGTVMDGAPVFNLARETLLGCAITGITGILNGTTNFILTAMEEGSSFDDALKTAQKYGWAEADPSMDIDGWDAAVKVSALMNVLMNASMIPQDIERSGIRGVTQKDLAAAKAGGETIKLLCQGYSKDGIWTGKVAPVLIPLDHPLAHVRGTTSALTLQTDLAGEITIEIKDPKIRQTAYALVTDLLTITK